MAKPSSQNQAAPVPEKPKRQRTVLTDAERLAKMEADLKAARERVNEKAGRKAKQLTEKRDKLAAKRDELNSQIEELNKEIEAATPTTSEVAGEDTES